MGDGTNIERIRPIQVKTSSTTYLSGIKAISAGSEFTIALDNSGKVWRWGEDQLFPKLVENLTNVIAINAGSWHSLALKSDGTVWAFGYNWSGQLGIGFNEYPNSMDSAKQYVKAVPVQGLTNVVAIDAGAEHSLALKSDGTVWVWGNDAKSQLGLGTIDRSKYYPVQNTSLSEVKFVYSGEYHNFVILNNNSIWTWGDNSYGQLGINNLESQISPIEVENLSEIVNICGGLTHSFAIKKIEGNT
ncbi:Regulator of chromosome condensation (RCC1) repeat protein [compost metagenome]